MIPLAIHTYDNFPKMFHILYLSDYSKVSTFLWTLGIFQDLYFTGEKRESLNKLLLTSVKIKMLT